MDSSALALTEVMLVFGGVIAFCVWQLHSLKKLARAREQESAASHAKTEGEPGPGEG